MLCCRRNSDQSGNSLVAISKILCSLANDTVLSRVSVRFYERSNVGSYFTGGFKYVNSQTDKNNRLKKNGANYKKNDVLLHAPG